MPLKSISAITVFRSVAQFCRFTPQFASGTKNPALGGVDGIGSSVARLDYGDASIATLPVMQFHPPVVAGTTIWP